jgi:hypothetical protein
MFLNMARAPYLPYVDVEVANNAPFVSLATRGINMTYNATAQCLNPPVAIAESFGSLSFSISSSLRERREFRNLFLNFSMPIFQKHLTGAGEPWNDVRRRTVSVRRTKEYIARERRKLSD